MTPGIAAVDCSRSWEPAKFKRVAGSRNRRHEALHMYGYGVISPGGFLADRRVRSMDEAQPSGDFAI